MDPATTVIPVEINDPVTLDRVVDVLATIHPDLLNQKCLDHGYVKVLDVMPRLVPAKQSEFIHMARCDFALADAARQSYQKGTRKMSDDAALIDHLIRNVHTSPIEMAELKFQIKLPIFVMRQHVRHRTACLTGSMRVSFDLPGGIRRRGNQHYSLTVDELFERRRDKRKWRAVANMQARSVNEETGEVYHTKITDIWYNGEKEVLGVTFDDGSFLEATEDHLCYTGEGWQKLGVALKAGSAFVAVGTLRSPVKSGSIVTDDEILRWEEWRSIAGYEGYAVSSLGRVASCKRTGVQKSLSVSYKVKDLTALQGYVAVSLSKFGKSRLFYVHRLVLDAFVRPKREGEECLHRDGVRDNNRLSNLSWGSPADNADDRVRYGAVTRMTTVLKSVHKVVKLGKTPVYDISVSGPYHNFVANGFVVHNSLNEMSARYSELPAEFYVPEPQDWSMNTAANKQATVKQDLDPLVAEQLHDWLTSHDEKSYQLYQKLLSGSNSLDSDFPDIPGISREQARMVLGVNIYTMCVWKMDLKNLLGYLKLRTDKHAQFEIRVFADAMARVVAALFPITWASYKDNFIDGVNFSAKELWIIQEALRTGYYPVMQDWSSRRWNEFQAKLTSAGFHFGFQQTGFKS